MATDTGLIDPPEGDDVMWSLNHSEDWYIGSDRGDDFGRMNWRSRIDRYDWEFRFTAEGSYYYNLSTD